MPLRQKRRGRVLVAAIFFLALMLTPLNGVALEESLPELVRYLTKEHNLVRAAESEVSAARERARVALGDWFPAFDLSLGYGLEKQNKPTASPDTSLTTRDADFKITQLLWDFGKTDAEWEASLLYWLEETHGIGLEYRHSNDADVNYIGLRYLYSWQ